MSKPTSNQPSQIADLKNRYPDVDTLNRADIVYELAGRIGCSQRAANDMVVGLMGVMTDAFLADFGIEFRGFGAFRPVRLEERTIFHPVYQVTKKVPARWTVRFRVSKFVRKMLLEVQRGD